MFKSNLKRLGGRLALITAAAALMAAMTASAASASPLTVTPDENLETEQNVVVKGTTVPAGTDHVAIAVCNMTVTAGAECDAASGTLGGFETETAFTAGISVPVRQGPWEGWNFASGKPAPTGNFTTCNGSLELDEPCSVLVSFYDTTMFGPKLIGTPETHPILFE